MAYVNWIDSKMWNIFPFSLSTRGDIPHCGAEGGGGGNPDKIYYQVIEEFNLGDIWFSIELFCVIWMKNGRTAVKLWFLVSSIFIITARVRNFLEHQPPNFVHRSNALCWTHHYNCLAFCLDVQSMVKEDTGVMPRAGLITVAGLGGIVLGYKGFIFIVWIYINPFKPEFIIVIFIHNKLVVDEDDLKLVANEKNILFLLKQLHEFSKTHTF